MTEYLQFNSLLKFKFQNFTVHVCKSYCSNVLFLCDVFRRPSVYLLSNKMQKILYRFATSLYKIADELFTSISGEISVSLVLIVLFVFCGTTQLKP